MEPAIRDFFDLHFASTNLGIDLKSPDFLDLVRRKIAVPGNGPIVLSAERRADLDRQIKSQLQPVLRMRDFERFNLARIWDKLVALANHLKEV